jgi:drug/metabolite transporter (DMT)-like permease
VNASHASATRWLGYALLFAGMTVTGSYVALSKPLTEAFPIFLLAWMRFAIAALAGLAWLRPRPGDQGLDRQVWQTLFAQSFFGNFLFSILMLSGLALTSASAAGVVLAGLPAVVALFSWWWLGETLHRRTLIAIALAAMGIALLSPAGGSNAGGASLLGNLLVFGCACCEAVYVILGKRLTGRLSARRISALINLVGLALTTPLGLWQALSFNFATVTPGLWLLLVFYAVAASMISTWLWLSGLKHVPASDSGVFTIALPLSSTAVGVWVLGESFSPYHAIALALAITGIVLVSWPRPSKA